MDNTIDHLKDELKKAQLELKRVKEETLRQVAEAKAAAKANVEKAVAEAYAGGIKKALTELEQPLQKQRKALAAAEAAAEKAGKKVVKVSAVKKAPAAKKPAAAKKAAATKGASAKPSAMPVAPAGSLHEKRLGILEREFSPVKSAKDNAPEDNANKGFANLDEILNKGDWS